MSVTSVGESRAGSGTLEGTVISVGDSSPEDAVCGLAGVMVSMVGAFTCKERTTVKTDETADLTLTQKAKITF